MYSVKCMPSKEVWRLASSCHVASRSSWISARRSPTSLRTSSSEASISTSSAAANDHNAARRNTGPIKGRLSWSRIADSAASSSVLGAHVSRSASTFLTAKQPSLPSPPLLVAHGLTATGKSSLVRSYLSLSGLPHSIIDSRECITGRHLLERTITSCLDALDEYDDVQLDRKPYSRTENLNALVTNLQRLLEGRGKFVLVLDGIDKQREAPPTLLPALARFGETVRPHTPLAMMILIQLTILDTEFVYYPHHHAPPLSAASQTRNPAPLLRILHALRPAHHPLHFPSENLPNASVCQGFPRLHSRTGC